MKWKAFTERGLNALVTCILWIKKTADNNTSAVSSLGTDLQNFARQTTEKLKEVVERLTELDTKLDKGDTAADKEVTEMLDEIFGASGGGPPSEVPDIAAEEEVAEMLADVFGSSGSQSQSGVATEQEVTEMLNEVFSSSNINKSKGEQTWLTM